MNKRDFVKTAFIGLSTIFLKFFSKKNAIDKNFEKESDYYKNHDLAG